MDCTVPHSNRKFVVPNEWWTDAGMDGFVPNSEYYPTRKSSGFEIVAVEDVEPPERTIEMFWRDRESVLEVLRKIRTGEEQEPIVVWSKEKRGTKNFMVKDGFHRFYLSIAIGYRKIPIKIDDFDLDEFLEKERNTGT
jgi:hypothetical protein